MRTFTDIPLDNKFAYKTIVKKKPENVVAVMPGCLKPYFYVVLRRRAVPNSLQQNGKTVQTVWDGEHIRKDFAFRVEDKAVVLIL